MSQTDQQWTYTSITEALHHRTIILRVHSDPNPLINGFEARNPAFKSLTPAQYHQATSSLRQGRWAEGPYMRDVIIDHLNNVVRRPPLHLGRLGKGRFELRTGGGDDLTPWISTTANLDWALWYISKQLASPLPHRGHQSSPHKVNGLGDRDPKVKMAIISISTDRTANSELYVAPFLFRPPNEPKGMSRVDRERYNQAKKSAIMAKEVLFYGRVFGKSVLADLTFTREELPFPLPSVYYKPPNMFNPSFQGSWLGRLRWDPRLLNYEMAQYNRMRMLGVRCIWVDQPVDSRLQEFSTREKDGDEPNEQERTESKAVRITAPQSPEPMDQYDAREVQEAQYQYREEDEDEAERCNVKVLEAELVDLSV